MNKHYRNRSSRNLEPEQITSIRVCSYYAVSEKSLVFPHTFFPYFISHMIHDFFFFTFLFKHIISLFYDSFCHIKFFFYIWGMWFNLSHVISHDSFTFQMDFISPHVISQTIHSDMIFLPNFIWCSCVNFSTYRALI